VNSLPSCQCPLHMGFIFAKGCPYYSQFSNPICGTLETENESEIVTK